MSNFETCSHCGEFRDAANHDAIRCWTISHAFAVVANSHGPDDYSEANGHIVKLSRWLRDHPHPSTPQGKRARADREVQLERWIKVAQEGSEE